MDVRMNCKYKCVRHDERKSSTFKDVVNIFKDVFKPISFININLCERKLQYYYGNCNRPFCDCASYYCPPFND